MTRPATVLPDTRLLAALGLALALSPDRVLATDICSTDQVTAWLRLRNDSLGVRAYDPNPFLAPDIVPLPGRPAYESCPSEADFSLDQDGRAHDGIHAWVFAHPCKLAVCGEPQSFEENRGIVLLSGEYDLNNNIRFGPEFKSEKLTPHLCAPDLLSSVAGPRHPRDARPWNLALQEPRLCFPDTKTLHVEITPPTSFRPLFRRLWVDDPPWGWRRWRNTLVGHYACVYGPFVADTAHDALAEIHPAQMYWWNERASGKAEPFQGDGPFALFVLQDASNRYTQPHHFVLGKAPPPGSGWKPWAGAPVEAVFEVPFWSERGHPPRFDLRPYEYDGEKTPSPRSLECTEDRVTELNADVDGRPVLVARACNATRADRPAAVEMDFTTICRCVPGSVLADLRSGRAALSAQVDPSAFDDWLCPDREGFLGKLTITARTGRPKEWREGALALMLFDSRSPTRKAPEVEKTDHARELPRDSASLLLSWRAIPGEPAWHPVRVTGSEMATAEKAMRVLYEEAGWPGDVPSPMTSLWQVSAVDLQARLIVPHLRDRERGDKELAGTQFAVEATPLLDHGAPPRERKPSSCAKAECRLPMDTRWAGGSSAVEPFRVDVTVQATARYPRPLQVASRDTLTEPAEERLDSTWTLWTHGLGSQPAALWHRSTRALCDHYLPARHAQDRKVELDPALENRDARTSPAAPPMVYENVRIATQRVLKDEVVSVGELALLVRSVERICRGIETVAPNRPVRAADASGR